MIISVINSAIAIVERLLGFRKKWRARVVTSVATRFVEMFEAHGVHRNQIPQFFGYGIGLSDLADDESLIKKLTEPVLDAACTKFAVRREWLDGAGGDPYVRHWFYKDPQSFAQFIDRLRFANPEAHFDGYLIVPNEKSPKVSAALILTEGIGTLGETVIYRYHFCDEWPFRYWSSRAYLAACVAIAWKKRVYIKGRFALERDLLALNGKRLPKPILSKLELRGEQWYAEDLALVPDQFLAGLDPEQNDFGITSALRLWLQLDSEGWMDTGLAKEVRPAFEASLGQYEAIAQS